MIHNLISFFGIFILMLVAWACSTDRRVVNLRVIAGGLAIQFVFAFFIFIVPGSKDVFLLVNDVVDAVLESASAGSRFLFGRLALPPGAESATGESSLGFFLAFQALPTIVFFSSLMGALYYLGVMPRLVSLFSRLFSRAMRISGAESLCAASNIFVGVEAATTVRPHLARMTASELAVVLTAGMSTVASNVLGLYVFILSGQFPTIAGHLVSATILSAPAAVIMAKLIVPETGRPETLGLEVKGHYERESSIMEAIMNYADAGLKLVLGIAAMLLAFLGLVALLDLALGLGGGWLNDLFGISVDWSIRGLLGYIFYPFTLLIGVPLEDAPAIARIIGERTVATEVASYQDLAVLLKEGSIANPRSVFLATYALCGFAHVASLAIFTGGVAALVPERMAELSKVGPRALLAATLACLLTACVAGVFYSEALGAGSILLGSAPPPAP